MGIITEKINGKMIDVEIQSSNITSASYDSESENLKITFKNGSIYEYTNIRVEELPEELQNEIREGKRLEGKDKLYGFLENYSS